MHFKTLVLASLSSLAAVTALPSGSPHDGHVMARHHRFIRPRKAEPAPSKVKRCAADSSSSSEAPEPTYVQANNAAAKPSNTVTKSAKFTTVTKSGSKTASETATDKAPAPTAGTGGISVNDKLLAIFPGGQSKGFSSWSTNPSVSNALALSDQALRATKVMAKLTHPVVNFSGKQAMKVSFDKGAYAYRSKELGGLSFYALGPANQPINNAKVLTFSYSVQFEKGFEFNKGGKLPGLYGGTSEEEAAGCSGGHGRDTCWSTRFMWRTGGAGELYAYLPPGAKSVNKPAVCQVNGKSNSSCDEDYGWSLGRSSWTWSPGEWQTIAQKVTLNDIGKSNGEVIVYMNGKQVYKASGIQLRVNKSAVPRGFMAQIFFGGHDESWASPKNQAMYLSDFSLAVLETE